LAPGDLQYTFFSNSGAEAVEAALKFARAATGKPEFVSTIGGYHGKTMGALAVTGREKYRKRFEPMLPTTLFTPYNDLPAIANAISERTAAVIIEALQGEGGIVVPEEGYLSGLRQLCTERGVLLIVDEVQTGLGRTGKMFASEHEGVVPDILCLAKALGGGVMPIGATMTNATLWDCVFGENPLLHTSTFGGNPLACAAGYAALTVLLDENMPENALERGKQMLTGLREIQAKHPNVLKEARGRGLMLGVEFHIQDYAEIVINLMAGRGIIAAYTLNNPTVIRIEPPLIVSEVQCAYFLEALEGAVSDATELMADVEA
jgi:putrescine aminotransferase